VATTAAASFIRELAGPGSRWRQVLNLYFLAALATFMLGVAVANNFVTPLHVALRTGPAEGILHWMVMGFAAGALLAVLALAVALLHKRASAALLWLAGMLLTTGVQGMGLDILLDGLNIHFDGSPVRKATAQVLVIESTKYLTRGNTPVMVLAEWRVPRGPGVRTRYNMNAFLLDAEKRHATFYWREGFLGRPYAVAYPASP
jgi:hypothetical protein